MKKVSKIKKIAAVALAAVMTMGTFAGCTGGKKEADDGKIHISVSPWPAKEGKDLDRANEDKAKFEADNPDIEVTGDSWKFDIQSFYPKAEAGMLPTVFTLHLTEIKKLSDGGYYKDWTKSLKAHDMYDKFSDTAMSLVKNDKGEMIGWPWQLYMMGIAINVDMFEAAGLMEADGTPKQPKDWNELAEFAVKIKNATGKSGFSLPTSNNEGGWLFTNIAWSFGTKFMEKGSDGKWKATFNTPETAEALQYIKDLKWKYHVLPESTITTQKEVNQNLATGNTAMALASDGVRGSVVSYGMEPRSLGMIAIPAGPKKRVALLGGSVFVAANNATDEQVDACVRWYMRAYNPFVNDTVKEQKLKSIQAELDANKVVGIDTMSVWSEGSDVIKLQKELNEEYKNININHVRLYNEAQTNGSVEVQSEEPVCAQDLYGILDNCIQNVLTNEDADCAALLEKANSDFQSNFLNNITY